MLTFLRKIRRSLVESLLSGHTVDNAGKPASATGRPARPLGGYLLYAIGEIALVVLGILIALQINNWNEKKKQDEVERHYMVSLLIDLEKDKSDLRSNVEFGSIPVIYNDSLFLELQKRPLQGNENRIYHFYLLYTNGIQLSYHDRTISQLRNSGGFGLISNQEVSDAVLDYDMYMRESIKFNESSRSNHLINNDILINNKIYELYKVEHLKDTAIIYKDEMHRVEYPNDMKLLTYDDFDINIALNSMSSVRKVDENNYQRAQQALEMNIKLDSLIRHVYYKTR